MNISNNSDNINISSSGYIPEDVVIVKEKSALPVNQINQRMVQSVADSQYFQQETPAGKTAEEVIRPFSQHVIPALLNDYDNKRMSIVIELCNVLLLDAINQQERRNTLEKQAVQQATLLKELKYEEADYQVAAAVAGALVSVAAVCQLTGLTRLIRAYYRRKALPGRQYPVCHNLSGSLLPSLSRQWEPGRRGMRKWSVSGKMFCSAQCQLIIKCQMIRKRFRKNCWIC